MIHLIALYIRMQAMLHDESGTTMVEYSLMVTFIAMAAFAAVKPLERISMINSSHSRDYSPNKRTNKGDTAMKNLTAKYIAMQSKMQSMLKDEKGATMVEYALMVALIAVVCITAVGLVGTNTNGTFNSIQAAL